MLASFVYTLLAAEAALASPLHARATAKSPTVKIQHGTVVGYSSSGVDNFLGIPFAQPPMGPLRLKPPQPITKSFGTIQATEEPMACAQMGGYVNTTMLGSVSEEYLNLLGFGNKITNTGEDCLTVNVQRPSGTASSSKLPVLFWIFGGGFEGGSTQEYGGFPIIQKSMSMGKPIIFVAVNYRLGGFGFLAGKELAAEQATNLGLRDQRLALEWVQQNIAAFGGDPNKVTIWGESAGSVSVFDQLLVNGGDNTYNGRALFRGAMMDSGSSIPADPVTAPQAQAIYDSVASAAGCSGSFDTLACLRSVGYDTFLNAASSAPSFFGYRALDLSYIPRPDPADNFYPQSPEVPLAAHQIAKVPLIIGDQQDEGTIFSLSTTNLSTNADLITYLSSYYPETSNAKSLVSGLLSLYPDQPLQGQPAGSPYNTGGLYNIYPQYKRLASVFGDLTFILTRRHVLNTVSPLVPSWSYLSSYLHGTPILGTFHASDVLFVFGVLTELPEPTQAIQEYYVNFVNYLNPNGPEGQDVGNSTLINWPQYSSSSPQLLHFLGTSNTLLPDTFRQPPASYIAAHASDFRI